MSSQVPGPRNTGATTGATRPETAGKEIRLDDGHDVHDTTAHDTHVVPSSDVRRDDHVVERSELRTADSSDVDRARGGFSFWSVLSGMFVAFGAFIILSAIIGGIMTALGLSEGSISTSEATNAGIAAAVGLVLAQFLAYLWGGYTAGRMARGSGVLNGIMVPIFALLLVAILGGVLAAIAGGSADAAASEAQSQAQNLPLPLPLSNLGELATGAGIGLLLAMLLGGALGGKMGQRWHRKLEDGETRYTN